MNDPSLDDERKKQIIACGLHALAGERYFDV